MVVEDTNAKIISDIEIKEKEITSLMLKNAQIILETSINDMMGTEEPKYENVLLSILHIQIALELFFKYYIINVYGFENILQKNYRKDIQKDRKKYLVDLNNSDIRTLGYGEIFKFLEKNDDLLYKVKESGSINFYSVSIECFKESFDKYNKIRNGIVHASYIIKEDEMNWLQTNFTVFIMFVVCKLLKQIKYKSKFKSYDEYGELDETPNEILSRFLSKETFEIIKNNKSYIREIEDVAMELGGGYECTECGKHSMVLNLEEGWSKCFYCGVLYYAGYTDCPICEEEDTVIYDKSNIEFNNNNLRGYCHECKNHMTVYRCPECGWAYAYDGKHKPVIDGRCCKEHFVTSYNAGVLDCPLCKKEKTLPYYGSDINCITKCDNCRQEMCVYICPDCGETYVYDFDIKVKIEKDCCKTNFKEYW